MSNTKTDIELTDLLADAAAELRGQSMIALATAVDIACARLSGHDSRSQAAHLASLEQVHLAGALDA